MPEQIMFSDGRFVLTDSTLKIGGSWIPLDQIESVTDEKLRRYTAVGILSGLLAAAGIVGSMVLLGTYPKEEWKALVAFLAATVFIVVASLSGGYRYNVIINRPFGNRTTLTFGTAAKAMDFLTALRRAKGELTFVRDEVGFFVGFSV